MSWKSGDTIDGFVQVLFLLLLMFGVVPVTIMPLFLCVRKPHNDYARKSFSGSTLRFTEVTEHR